MGWLAFPCILSLSKDQPPFHYLPLALGGFSELSWARPALGVYLIGSLGLAAGLALLLGQKARARPDAHRGTARFYRHLAFVLAGSAALGGAITLGAIRRGPEAALTELGLIALSIAPTAALAHGVHRCYAIRPLVRRGLVDATLAVLALAGTVEGVAYMVPSLAARARRGADRSPAPAPVRRRAAGFLSDRAAPGSHAARAGGARRARAHRGDAGERHGERTRDR